MHIAVYDDLVFYFQYASSAYSTTCASPNGNTLVTEVSKSSSYPTQSTRIIPYQRRAKDPISSVFSSVTRARTHKGLSLETTLERKSWLLFAEGWYNSPLVLSTSLRIIQSIFILIASCRGWVDKAPARKIF